MSTATATATRRVMLVKVDTVANNNKFYEISLLPDGSVVCRYGRVGADGVTQVYYGGQAKFDSQMASKKKKGYAEVDLIDAPAGMASSAKSVASASLASAARKSLLKEASDAALAKLIDQWAAANRHQIEMASGGMMTVSASGAVSTPVGIVSSASIAAARDLLPQIQQRADRRLIEQYLTYVPQDFGRTRGWESRFESSTEIDRQAAFLDQLDGSVAMATSLAAADSGKADEPAAIFRYKLVRVTDAEKLADARRRFESTKNGMHQSSSLSLKNLYAVIDSEPHVGHWGDAAKAHGNVRRLWHGTGTANLLSMFHRGFVVPKGNGGSIHVTGRMFGDGAYFSDQSTKSLNYAQGGTWGGTRNDHCFMFLCDVVMGKEHRPSTYGDAVSAAKRASCHSVYAKGGTASVRNNEMIVWDLKQVRISYLCEFGR